MSQHSGDYEDFLRGALHAAVDSVEPAGDGLERIRARLTTPRPLPVAWLMAACSWVATYARGSLDSVSAWLQTVPRALARPGGAGERSQATERQRQLDRLRLVFTVAAVTILMAVSVSALTPFGRHVLSQAGAALTSIGGGGEAAGTGEPGASGPGGSSLAVSSAGSTVGHKSTRSKARQTASGAAEVERVWVVVRGKAMARPSRAGRFAQAGAAILRLSPPAATSSASDTA